MVGLMVKQRKLACATSARSGFYFWAYLRTPSAAGAIG